MKLSTPRGIRDIPPEEYEAMLDILDIFRRKCRIFGFKLMEPATIEKFEVLALKSGEEIEKEIYSFIDKGGRKLGLRFDLTVGLTRYVVSRPELQKPVKLGAFSIQWRYDEPQKGRYRSFYAWDIEIYGGDEVYSAVETITFTDELLKDTGLSEYTIKISDRRVVENILRRKYNIENPIQVMRILDKWGKLSEKDIIKHLIEIGLNENVAKDIIKTFFQSKRIDYDDVEADKLNRLLDLLKTIGLNSVELDLSIVRGLDYYDGIVFEVRPKNQFLSIVGGGNYSSLVKVFGGDFNAFGAAGGIERLLMYTHKKPEEDRYGVYIIPIIKEAEAMVIDICRQLRSLGIRCEYPLASRSINKNLRYAVRNSYKWALFIGEEEMRGGYYTLKDLDSGKQYKKTLNDIINTFK